MAWGSLRFDGHLGDLPGSIGWRTTSTETESPFSVRISDVNEVHNLASDRSTAVAECVIAPTEIGSTPVRATLATVSSVTPPDGPPQVTHAEVVQQDDVGADHLEELLDLLQGVGLEPPPRYRQRGSAPHLHRIAGTVRVESRPV